MSRGGPATGVLWIVAAVGIVVGSTLLVASPRSPWGSIVLGIGLLAAALALADRIGGAAAGPAEESRRPQAPTPEDAGELVGRRPLLARAVAGGLAMLGLGGLAALWRFGPRQPRATSWGDGVRAVDEDGQRVRADDLPPAGVVTVWPEGAPRTELAATLVLRLAAPSRDGTQPAGAIVAYSRVCTHAGCAVALFRADEGVLYCPCHQATFDARDGAAPVSGPAPSALPRLAMETDDEGFLIARGDYDVPPGPLGGGPAQ